MDSLKKNCIPRKFEQNSDVQDIIDLVQDRIDPAIFFETNHKTSGMSLLFKTAFERFKGKGQQKLIKLTQSMGGGKTHNMVSLGLIAKNEAYRQQIIGPDYKNDGLGTVKVLAFSGRQSNTPRGIWGDIIKQLDREGEFKDLWD